MVVVGTVKSTKEFPFGTSVDLIDDTGIINVWLRDFMRKDVPADLIKEGSGLRVTGEVSKFKDRLQVQPQNASDLVKEASPPPPVAVPADATATGSPATPTGSGSGSAAASGSAAGR